MFIGYLRVSTDRQLASGLGLEAQREAIERYAVQQGAPLGEVFVEAESGAQRDRPQLTAALAMCRRQKATLLIAKLDRLARNVAFVSALMETGVEFVAVDAPYANRLMIHILSAFAQHEREQISERTKGALAAAKSRGVKLGLNGRVLAERHKAEAIEFAQSLRGPVDEGRAAGHRSLRALGAYLTAHGIVTSNGGAWHPGTVKRVLDRLAIYDQGSGASPSS